MQPGKKINKYLDLWSFRIIIKDQLNQEKRKVIAHDVQKKALDTDCVILDKSFFMIEYKTVEKKWLDYRDIMQTLYGERFPRLFYLPLLKEVYRKRESCIPVSDVFDLYGRR